jgi:molybdopterin-guanine dinucleotide biosynthesis protein A
MGAGIPGILILTDQPELFKQYRGFVVLRVKNPEEGHMGQVAAALEYCKSTSQMILPGHLGGLSSDVMNRLINESLSRPAHIIYAATFEKEYPTCAVVNRGILPSVKLAIEEKRYDLLELYKTLDHRVVRFADQSLFE